MQNENVNSEMRTVIREEQVNITYYVCLFNTQTIGRSNFSGDKLIKYIHRMIFNKF